MSDDEEMYGRWAARGESGHFGGDVEKRRRKRSADISGASEAGDPDPTADTYDKMFGIKAAEREKQLDAQSVRRFAANRLVRGSKDLAPNSSDRIVIISDVVAQADEEDERKPTGRISDMKIAVVREETLT